MQLGCRELTAQQLKPLNLNGWFLAAVLVSTIVISGIVGYNLARLMAWLRVVSGVLLYLPWCQWDRDLARKMPLLRHSWAVSRDLGPTRDLLPVSMFYCYLVFENQSLEAAIPLSQAMLSGLISALVTGVVWHFVLRRLANSAGLRNWIELKEAGLGD